MLRSCAPTAAPMLTKSPSLLTRRTAAVHRRGEIVLAQVDVMREAAGRKHDGLARTNRDVLPSAVSASTPMISRRGVADQSLHAMSRADFDTVAPRRLGHRPDRDLATVRHRVASVFGQQHAAFGRLVLGQFAPIVGHVRAMAVFQRALWASSSAAVDALS